MALAVVAGALANRPRNGGGAWVRVSWVCGLRRLGYDTWFVEQIDRAEPEAVDFFDAVMRDFGLGDRALLVERDTPSVNHALELAETAELLINLSGHLDLEPLFDRFHRKVFVDLDPGFTQFWHAAGNSGARLAGHDLYFTIGENIGTDGCPIPTGGIDWRRIRPPVVLEQWPVTGNGVPNYFTTIGSWRGPYGPVDYNGQMYGLKLHEFRKFVELPERAEGTFELALSLHPDERSDIALLRRHGWRLADPVAVAADPSSFRDYVQGSGAEFSCAQNVYVETDSGWFSDRTARYLASGKPALVQETGFSRNLPTGEGLVPFRTLEEAVAGVREIARNYETHAEAARSIAESYFDSDEVLTRFLEETL